MIISGNKVTVNGGGGREPIVEALSVTANGTYTPSDGVDGFNPVEVNVQPPLQTKAIEITANGQSTIEADSEYYGLESVGLNVNVQPKLQTKSTSTTITENGTSTITVTPDSGYDGLSSANVTITTNVAASMPTLVLKNGIKFRISGDADLRFCDISNMTNMSQLFYFCESLTSLDLSSWDISNITNINEMFSYCKSLPSLDLSGWNTSNVTSMNMTFHYCQSLTSLDLSGWDTSNVTNIEQIFFQCIGLTSLNLSGWNTSKVTKMNMTFAYCKSLPSLDLSGWDTSNVTNLYRMFDYCKGLTSLNLSGWNTSKVTNMNMTFGNCESLTSLDLSGWDTSNVTIMANTFNGCKALTNLNMTNAILPKMDLTNWYLDKCTKLTVESLVSVLNALPQLDEGQSFTCTLGSTSLAKLSDEQKAIATNKNWIIN